MSLECCPLKYYAPGACAEDPGKVCCLHPPDCQWQNKLKGKVQHIVLIKFDYFIALYIKSLSQITYNKYIHQTAMLHFWYTNYV